MTTLAESTSKPLRSVLFVDFDNIYLTLCRLDKGIAEKFATRPSSWISWLESHLPTYAENGTAPRRNILVRRCYLNPASFSKFRTYFTQSAFETVDCPSLTASGKNSADIHIVVDALELLEYKVIYDEFIIMSTDADFRPLLLKLRKQDRRTAVLAIGSASLSYLKVGDHAIDQQAFIEEALGMSTKENCSRLIQDLVRKASEPVIMDKLALQVRETYPDIASDWLDSGSFKLLLEELDLENLVISSVAPGYVYDPSRHEAPTNSREDPDKYAKKENCSRLIQDLVHKASEPVIMSKLASQIIETYPDIASDWLGSGSFKLLLEELDLKNLVISSAIPGHVYDPSRHEAPTDSREDPDRSAKKGKCSRLIQDFVRKASEPVTMGELANQIRETYPDIASNWLESGSFKLLVEELDLKNLTISPMLPGYVYDPSRHDAPTDSREDREEGFKHCSPELVTLARKIHNITGTPYLSPEHYNILFEAIATEINENGYNLSAALSKAVRDRCKTQNVPVARNHVGVALQGIVFAGHWFGESTEKSSDLSYKFYINTVNLCRGAQLPLSEDDEILLRQWLCNDTSEK